MFCYNCGNQVDNASACPFCKTNLPPLKPALVEKALQLLNSNEESVIDDDSEFVPGELPIYERYVFEKKRTLFGLMKIVKFIIGLLADDGREVPDYWQETYTDIKIHRDKLILNQRKEFWIILTPWTKSYGKKEKTVALRDVTALVRRKENLLVLQFGGQEFPIPTVDGFKPDGLAYNLRAANPAIQFKA